MMGRPRFVSNPALDRPPDRRLRRRYVMERNVRYRVLEDHRCVASGSGRTVNVSSNGVLFTTETPLAAGQSVELTVSWPALLDGICPLKLMIFGTVTRAEERQAAIAIRRYEFRTQRASDQKLALAIPPGGALSGQQSAFSY